WEGPCGLCGRGKVIGPCGSGYRPGAAGCDVGAPREDAGNGRPSPPPLDTKPWSPTVDAGWTPGAAGRPARPRAIHPTANANSSTAAATVARRANRAPVAQRSSRAAATMLD